MALTDKLTAIGDAIREKTGSTAKLSLDQMVDEIEGISAGGGDTSVEDAFFTGKSTPYTNTRITTLRNYAFKDCYFLTSINVPNVTTAGAQAFYSCSGLSELILDNLTTATNSMCYNCRNMITFSAATLTDVPQDIFGSCNKLANVNLPSATNIGKSAFNACYALKKLELPSVLTLQSYAFTNANNFATLIIRTTSQVVTLVDKYVFNNTAIKSGGTGYVYVPDALVEDYKVATNWSNFADQIKPLSEYVEVS